jgi:murein DD-endopeptidase MepM/ murein hydrolase activator NlpD
MSPLAVALIPLLLLPLPISAGAEPRYRWPVAPPEVLRRFEPPPERWLPGHRGVDLGSVPGAPVRSAGDGVVVYAQTLAGRGVVSILHAGGLRTTYEPVTASVRAGDRVTAGRMIGALDAGHPGCPAAACLHWGLRRGDVYLDPLALLGLGRVRLLPLD